MTDRHPPAGTDRPADHRTPLEKAHDAAQKSARWRETIFSAVCLFLLAAIVATGWWLVSL